jgi:mannosyl-oligosaccharide glucosidase
MSLDNLDYLRDAYARNPEYLQVFLDQVYKKFKKQYEWFRDTQWGEVDKYGRQKWNVTEGYRWRGRKGYHTLTSGMLLTVSFAVVTCN